MPDVPENDDTRLIPLDRQGLLAVEGPDAARFLQGQITCDVQELAARHTRLGAQCNLKGRMLASFRALQAGDEQIILRMDQGLVDSVQKALSKYIVFSKAELRNARADYRLVGLCGPDAAKMAKTAVESLPVNDGDWAGKDGHRIIRLSGERYECWLSADKADALLEQWSTEAQTGDETDWILQDIRAGLGAVLPQTQETFTPQALNFQFIDAINFKKGCYTGQEVVARLHYKGKLKRHMYRLGGQWPDDQALPEPGSEVQGAAGSRSPGQFVLAARSGPNRMEALAVINDSALTDGQLHTGNQTLAVLPLPYAIT